MIILLGNWVNYYVKVWLFKHQGKSFLKYIAAKHADMFGEATKDAHLTAESNIN